jgi:hypothetical protein
MRTFAYALLVALVAVASANDVTAPNLALRGGSAKPPVAGAAAVRATAPATQASTIRVRPSLLPAKQLMAFFSRPPVLLLETCWVKVGTVMARRNRCATIEVSARVRCVDFSL